MKHQQEIMMPKKLPLIVFQYFGLNRIQVEVSLESHSSFCYLKALDDNSVILEDSEYHLLPSSIAKDVLISKAEAWWKNQDKELLAAIDPRIEDRNPGSVNFFTLKQFERLVSDVNKDRELAEIFINNPTGASEAFTCFGLLWHGLRMVGEYVSKEIQNGKSIQEIVIKPDFWQQPFMYRGECYEMGLYHVVKYSAFDGGKKFIDEYETAITETQLWELLKDYTSPFRL